MTYLDIFTNDEINFIKNSFKQFKNLDRISTSIIKFLKLNNNILNKCNKLIEFNSNWLAPQYIIIAILKNMLLNKCIICNKELNYLQSRRHNSHCLQCKYLDTQTKIKRNTSLKKYYLLNYGVTNPQQVKSIKEKTQNTMKQKYGVKNALESPEILNKMINTIKLKFNGVSSALLDPEVQKKSKKTLKERYNEDYNAARISSKNMINSFLPYVTPLFNVDEYIHCTNKHEQNLLWKCNKCGNEFYQKICTTHFNKDIPCLPRCLNCVPYINTGTSQLEQELIDYCKGFGFNVDTHNFEIITPYELDIIIPTYKIALEFNGSYYHSIDKKPLGYHLMKSELARKAGYRLLHIWEDEWLNREKNRIIC